MRWLEEWIIYDRNGEVSFNLFPHLSMQKALAEKRTLEYLCPENGPYFVVVYFVNKATGELVAGKLPENQESFDEAS